MSRYPTGTTALFSVFEALFYTLNALTDGPHTINLRFCDAELKSGVGYLYRLFLDFRISQILIKRKEL